MRYGGSVCVCPPSVFSERLSTYRRGTELHSAVAAKRGPVPGPVPVRFGKNLPLHHQSRRFITQEGVGAWAMAMATVPDKLVTRAVYRMLLRTVQQRMPHMQHAVRYEFRDRGMAAEGTLDDAISILRNLSAPRDSALRVASPPRAASLGAEATLQ